MSLGRILETAAEKWGDRTALVADAGEFTYRDLHVQTNRLAQGLSRKLRIEPEDRVLILLDNCAEAVMIYHAVLKAGAVPIPCNTNLTSGEVEFLLVDSRARALVTSCEYLPKLEPLRPAVNELKGLLLTDGENGEALSWEACLDGMPEESPEVAVDLDAVALIVYTSGTTGRPKGAMLTHRGYLANLEAIRHVIVISSEDCVLMMLPHFHIFPLTVCVFYAFFVGSRVAVLKMGRSFEKILQAIAETGTSILPAVPPIFHILSHKRIPEVEKMLARVRLGISGGANLPAETLREFEDKFDAVLLDAYGMTEGGPLICINREDAERKPGSAGRPIPGVKLRILDDEGHDLSPGEIGEIAVSSPGLMKGYLGQPEAAQEVLRGGWLLTGDVGTMDEEGSLYILDRKKDVIIVQGVNVYPREIENVLCSHPGIAEAAVFREKRGNTEIPVAAVRSRLGVEITPREILEYCRQQLAPYKIPRRVHIVDELPRTPVGKVRKEDLARLLAAGRS